MKPLRYLLLGLLTCLLGSCEYKIAGDHFEDINPNPPIAAEVLLDNQKDTIFVRGDINLTFQVALPGRVFYGYELLLDNTSLFYGGNLTETYKLQSNKYSDGYHTLKLVAAGNAATGSLADVNRREHVEVIRTWVVHIDNAPPAPVVIARIYERDGRLRVEWPPARKFGFLKYEVYRYPFEGSNQPQLITTFFSVDSTSWTDHFYVAGTIRYKIVAYGDQSNTGVQGPVASFTHPPPRILQTSFNQNYELSITFTSTPFYRNLREYEVTLHDARIAGTTISSTVSTDTVLTIPDPGFGADFKLKLTTHRKQPLNSSGPDGPTISTEIVVPGYGFPWAHAEIYRYVMRPQANVFFDFYGGFFRTIDPATLQAKQQRDIGHAQAYESHLPKNVVSEDGRFIYSILDRVIHKIDPVTLQTLETYTLHGMLGLNNYTMLRLFDISNTNRLLLGAKGYNYRDSVYLVDMEQKKLLHQRLPLMYSNYAKISQNGKALLVDNKLWLEQNDGSWQVKRTLIAQQHMHPLKPELFEVRNRSIAVYSTETGEQLRTINTADQLYSVYIDRISGLLAAWGDGNDMFYVYNPETGQLIRKLKIAKWGGGAMLYGDKIISDKRYLPL